LHLKQLTIQGFKSFAGRVDIKFYPAITAIVGPNGSGKSNIVDAVRWVLGEQNPRTLRGTHLPDVIFAGSDKTRPLGMAAVELTLDNSDGHLPLEYSEVTITRQVFRSGESRFFINRHPCRLKDIQDLFLDTGLGRNSFFFIGQGEVAAVLTATPVERRLFLEDAAGIARYRAHKTEAQEKLADTAENLVRVKDIIAEVEDRLGPLRQAAALARKHRELSAELASLEQQLLSHEWHQLQKQLARETARDAELSAELNKITSGLAQCESRLQTEQKALQESLACFEEVQAQWHEKRREEQEIRHQAEMLRERESRLVMDVERQQRLVAAAGQQKAQLQAALQAVEDRWQNLARRLSAVTEVHARLTGEKAGLAEKVAAAGAGWQKARARLSAAETAAARWGGELAGHLKDDPAGEARRRQNLAREKEEVQKHLEAAELERGELGQQKEALERSLAAERSVIAGETRQLAEIAKARKEAGQKLSRHQSRCQEVKARLHLLRELSRSYEGYNRGVKTIMAAGKRFAGLIGAIGEMIEVSPGYEAAIEAALGPLLHAVLMAGMEEVLEAASYLREKKGGRTAFLPLAALSGSAEEYLLAEEAKARLAEIPGFVGLAYDLVQCREEACPATALLLGKVAVCRDIKSAWAAVRAVPFPGGCRLAVTCEGELVTPEGVITAGESREDTADSLLVRQRTIQELARELEQLVAGQKELEAEATMLNRRFGELTSSYEARQKRIKQLEMDLSAVERKLKTVALEIQNWQRRRNRLHEEEKAFDQAVQEKSERLKLVQAELQAAQEEQAAAAMQLEAAEKEKAAIEGSFKELEERLAAVTVELAELRQRVQAEEREKNRIRSSLKDAEQREVAAGRGAAQALADRKALAAEFARKEEGLKRCRTEIAALNEQKAALQAQLAERRQLIAGQLETEKTLRRQKEELMERAQQCRINQERIKAALLAVDEKAAEKGLEIIVPDTSFSPAAARKQVKALSRELVELGPVNHGAIAELEAVETRYNYLRKQCEDLQTASKRLEETIREIDQTTRKKLLDTFAAVNAAFGRLFSTLFGGGRAECQWLDEADPLESGITITAAPPGKKPQSLLALSGGERALTAVAFLFAVLSVRPSPFCILDEIDASLDEANIAKFARLLVEFSKNTQFIVITHRRQTMETADTLYGVVMNEKALSQLISLRLAEEYALVGGE